MRYLPLSIFTNPVMGDCSNKGVSTTHWLFIEVPDGSHDEAYLEKLRQRGVNVQVMFFDINYAGGKELPYLKAEGEMRWTMFGGNFAWSSDDRVAKLYPEFKQPVAIFDRIE